MKCLVPLAECEEQPSPRMSWLEILDCLASVVCEGREHFQAHMVQKPTGWIREGNKQGGPNSWHVEAEDGADQSWRHGAQVMQANGLFGKTRGPQISAVMGR